MSCEASMRVKYLGLKKAENILKDLARVMTLFLSEKSLPKVWLMSWSGRMLVIRASEVKREEKAFLECKRDNNIPATIIISLVTGVKIG